MATDKTPTISQFEIEGMDCADCALKIEKEVAKLQNVKSARVNFMNSRLKVEFHNCDDTGAEIGKAVESAGYKLKSSPKSKKTTFIVQGMDCADESTPIENRLRKTPGIYDVRFNLVAGKMIVEHDIPAKQIMKIVSDLGFESSIEGRQTTNEARGASNRHRSLIFTVAAGLLTLGGVLSSYFDLPQIWSSLCFLAAILSGGIPFGVKGFKEARNLTLGMNFLMSAAVIGAVIIGEMTEAAMVVFLFSLAQLLEALSMDKAKRSIRSLMALAPNMATVKIPQGRQLLPVEEVQIGEVILIKPGERIPLDGEIVTGESSVNQAPITGESLHLEKAPGDPVFAGTINQHGRLEIKVTREFRNSLLSRIIHLVEEAQAQKAPTQRFIDKFARYYTPIMVALAVLIAVIPPLLFGGLFTVWIYRALVLLVISCPCALVISTPVTIVSSLTNAARCGILIKGGVYLEIFDQIRALAFDKTGTLTAGRPQVKAVRVLNGYSENEIIQIAAAIEENSEHHLGKALTSYANFRGFKPLQLESFRAISGKGVTARINSKNYYIGNHRLFEELGLCQEDFHHELGKVEEQNHTAVILGTDEEILAIFSISDTLREDARRAVETLHEGGISKVAMLTGDNHLTAETIAQEVGIDEVYAELLPEDKVKSIKDLKNRYGSVAMVGDGINDAPALAAADIGISMGHSATDAALETADIVLMKDDLKKISYLKALSRKSSRIIKQNIFVALLLKGIFFGLALPGLATLWMAVFADMGASLLVIFNGLRGLSSSSQKD